MESATKFLVLHNLCCMYFNAMGILNKFDEFKVMVADHKPDIIGISESHLTSTIPDSMVCLTGYQLYRSDRTARGNGGVALYIKCSIPSFQKCAPKDPDGEWESLWCSISLTKPGSILVGCVYRIPSSHYPNHWLSLHSTLSNMLAPTSNALSLCIGDFNFPSIDWASAISLDPAHSASSEFLDILKEHNLIQHVSNPTRHRVGQRSSLLDLIIASPSLTVSPITHSNPMGKSDHDTLFFSVCVEYSSKLSNTVQA